MRKSLRYRSLDGDSGRSVCSSSWTKYHRNTNQVYTQTLTHTHTQVRKIWVAALATRVRVYGATVGTNSTQQSYSAVGGTIVFNEVARIPTVG
jgi:hypothetical protein